ncbi:hypothetical protein [Micromonospora cremea]|uniref:Uncharacterized protein n=1 Tax=Micromonospora cremea TaxID=709881 RepID=A0A1N5YQX0_9ACTN|nr:hypothetical protein [Micromonospora cremea]SIN12016.1 hypothetical protein SAMN04489832_3163 [Micromonospora cremea]
MAGPWLPLQSDQNLQTLPVPGLPGNRPPGEDLDLRLGWDRFEKLLLAVARRALGLRGINCGFLDLPTMAQAPASLTWEHECPDKVA